MNGRACTFQLACQLSFTSATNALLNYLTFIIHLTAKYKFLVLLDSLSFRFFFSDTNKLRFKHYLNVLAQTIVCCVAAHML